MTREREQNSALEHVPDMLTVALACGHTVEWDANVPDADAAYDALRQSICAACAARRVYLFGRMPCAEYLGFGAEVVASSEDGTIVMIALQPEHATWQAMRLASGLRLRNGDGRGIQPYPTRAAADAALAAYTQWWR